MLISPIDNIVVWFCSLYRKSSADMKIVVYMYDLIKKSYVIVVYIIYFKLLKSFFLVKLMYNVLDDNSTPSSHNLCWNFFPKIFSSSLKILKFSFLVVE